MKRCPSSAVPLDSPLPGSPARGLPGGWWPWHLSISSERPRIPFSLWGFRLSGLDRPCPFSLAPRLVIGVADSRLPGCLKPPSCALCRRSTSQHYCSCWAFFLKSFPAVSWYGKPLKLAPDCSVYFVLDKRQNTVPAASQEEGGSGGMGTEGHRQGPLQMVAFADRAVKSPKCDAITGPAIDEWSPQAGQGITLDLSTAQSRKENQDPRVKSHRQEARFLLLAIDTVPLSTTGLVAGPAIPVPCLVPWGWREFLLFFFKLSICIAMPGGWWAQLWLKSTSLPICLAVQSVLFRAVILSWKSRDVESPA